MPHTIYSIPNFGPPSTSTFYQNHAKCTAQFTTAVYFKVAVLIGNPVHSKGLKSKCVVRDAEELV